MVTEYTFEASRLPFMLISVGYAAIGTVLMGAIVGAVATSSNSRSFAAKA